MMEIKLPKRCFYKKEMEAYVINYLFFFIILIFPERNPAGTTKTVLVVTKIIVGMFTYTETIANVNEIYKVSTQNCKFYAYTSVKL